VDNVVVDSFVDSCDKDCVGQRNLWRALTNISPLGQLAIRDTPEDYRSC